MSKPDRYMEIIAKFMAIGLAWPGKITSLLFFNNVLEQEYTHELLK